MLRTGTSTSTICYPKLAVECTFLGYANPMDIPKINSIIFFNSLIMSVFLCEVEAWGAAYQRKFLDKIDRFLKRAHRFGFTTKKTAILDLIKNRDSELFKNVISGDHIPPKRRCVLRECKHDFILPRVKTERFKHFFLNRCLFRLNSLYIRNFIILHKATMLQFLYYC